MPWRAAAGRLSPLVRDLVGTRGATLGQDAIAGTITAILLIPQALAYGVLAGLPPQVGLYASVVPPLVYALLGGSRTLAVGPVAVAAVMVAAALSAHAGDDPARYLTGALVLSALTGVFLLGLAVLRMGWLTHFISHPVLSGFTTGAAIFIIGTQVAALCGLPSPRADTLLEFVHALVPRLGEAHLPTLAVGALSLLALVLARAPLRHLLERLGLSEAAAGIVSRTAPLVVVVIAIGASSALGLAGRGVAVIGAVPAGLPGIDLSFLRSPGWAALMPAAAMIALIGYVESISVARALAFRRHEKVDPDRELMALGVTNIAGACVGSMPVAGGFSRSMVNFDAGARTQAAAVVTALLVGTAALFFTGLLRELPRAVLAAVIVVAVFQLIDLHSLRRTWRYDRWDGLAQGATVVGVLGLGIEGGLLVGVTLGVAAFMIRTSRPHIAVVGRIADTEHFRNVDRHAVQTWPKLLLLRVDENIYFANAPRVENDLMHEVVEREGLQSVVLILSGVGHIDASGLEMLESFERSLGDKGIQLHLAEVKGPVMDRLASTSLMRQLGSGHIHLSTQQAVERLA